MTTYRADITSYAGKMAPLVKRVFDTIPSEMAHRFWHSLLFVQHQRLRTSVRGHGEQTVIQIVYDIIDIGKVFETQRFSVVFPKTTQFPFKIGTYAAKP